MGFVGTAVLESYAFVSVFEDFKLKYADLGSVEIEVKRCGYSSIVTSFKQFRHKCGREYLM